MVLVTPEIHWNTGNIGRTCLGANACLHLIRPLGFEIDDKSVKRAGLDYWKDVALFVWNDIDDFYVHLQPSDDEIALFTKNGRKPYWTLPDCKRLFLVFGSETKGLPKAVLSRYPNQTFYIPISNKIRCLNLSTAVGIGLFESIRA